MFSPPSVNMREGGSKNYAFLCKNISSEVDKFFIIYTFAFNTIFFCFILALFYLKSACAFEKQFANCLRILF